MVEHHPVEMVVAGSNPVSHPKRYTLIDNSMKTRRVQNPHNSSELIPIISFLVGGIAFLVLFKFIANVGFFLIEFPPSYRQSDFVRACGALNGNDYTVEHIKNLWGLCVNNLMGGLDGCNTENISVLVNRKGAPTFTIYEDGYSHSWSCDIEKTLEGKIRAVPRFRYK
jgi:hypothetical protein